MGIARITLLLLAALMAAEAAWAIARPTAMRQRVRSLLVHGGITGPLHRFFWGAALLLWALAWTGQDWPQRILFFLGVLAMAAGIWGQRPEATEQWYHFFLGRRSPAGIRAIYLLELALAALLAAVAVYAP